MGRWLAIFLLVGVAWRLVRYGLGFPVWGDEAMLMLGLVERHAYLDLLRPLPDGQIAPFGFLAAQFTVVRLIGTSEYALRLVPLITSLGGLLVFARLAWLALPPLAAVYALGVLTATHYVTRYSLDIKPYGADLLAASALLLLALEWRRRPEQRRWLLFLTVAAPVALVLSYPAIFVAAAVSLWALLARMRRSSDLVEWGLFVGFNAAVLGAFAGILYLWAAGQHAASGNIMLGFWAEGLPPGNPVRFVVWLLDVHTGEMLSYPLGGQNGGSTATLLLCLVGIRALLRRGDKSLLLLLGSIFALTLLAAVFRRYPYGGGARVAQHLAPAICLFVGAGIESIAAAFRTPERRKRAAAIGSIVLLLVALGGTVRDVVHPYHTVSNQRVRAALRAWQQERAPDGGTHLANGFAALPPSLRWYLLRVVGFQRPLLHEGALVPSTARAHREWWVLDLELTRGERRALAAESQLGAAGFAPRQSIETRLTRYGSTLTDQSLELRRWQRIESSGL